MTPETSRAELTVFAPAGIGEVRPGDDLVALVQGAVDADACGPLQDGDVVVITSKVVSKAEGRARPGDDRVDAVAAEAVATVARRGATRIVRTRHGLTLAAAGVDASNVEPGTVLLLPEDPDASAERLRAGLAAATGRRIGVVVSDTAGRAWRVGQTDQAIGAAGVRVLDAYAGTTDPYGNPLVVTAMATADELAAAADLAKGKTAGRPVAVVRGRADAVVPPDPAEAAASLVRPDAADLFGRGTREAVVGALARAVGHPEAYEDLAALDGTDLTDAMTRLVGGPPEVATLVRALLAVAAYADPGATPAAELPIPGQPENRWPA